MKTLRSAVSVFVLLTLITGVLYPLSVSLVSSWIFPTQAGGSLIRDSSGTVRGSSLIGQQFTSEKYFWSRPSATSPFPYNSASSSGSNLGPTNPALTERVKNSISVLKAGQANANEIPVDLVTTSGSGLDPHISEAAARYQAARVARTRGFTLQVVLDEIAKYTEERTIGVLGERRVNVLSLNLALDKVPNKK